MRWLLCLILPLVVAATTAAQENEAEMLFKAFEQKLTAAKVWKVTYETTIPDSLPSLQSNGSMIVSAGNKVKLTKDSKQSDSTKFKWTILADGLKIGVHASEKTPEWRSTAVPEDLTAYARRQFTHVGAIHAVLALEKVVTNRKVNFTETSLKLSEFKSLGKEKVGDRETNVIEYSAFVRVPPNHTVKLWLDAETNLPLKRLELRPIKKTQSRHVETYSHWNLDPVLKNDEFAFPK